MNGLRRADIIVEWDRALDLPGRYIEVPGEDECRLVMVVQEDREHAYYVAIFSDYSYSRVYEQAA